MGQHAARSGLAEWRALKARPTRACGRLVGQGSHHTSTQAREGRRAGWRAKPAVGPRVAAASAAQTAWQQLPPLLEPSAPVRMYLTVGWLCTAERTARPLHATPGNPAPVVRPSGCWCIARGTGAVACLRRCLPSPCLPAAVARARGQCCRVWWGTLVSLGCRPCAQSPVVQIRTTRPRSQFHAHHTYHLD
jgi:hypothetical protein